MKITHKPSLTMVFVFLVCFTGHVHAESSGAAKQQQELNKVLEMMKKQGMDAKTQKQMENMFKKMSEVGAKQQAAKVKKEQQKFEAETAGHGTARVEVGGKQYELKMLKCEIADRNTGSFSMHARQAPGKDSGELWVVGGGGPSRNNVQFIFGKRDPYEVDSNPAFQLNGKDLEWQGTVIRGGNKEALKFRLTCGAEMVDYATPSKPNPESSVNVLTLQMGKEMHRFQAEYCSKKEYRTGNLIVEFDAMATGTFRGRPVIIFLSKSHAAKEYGGEYFQGLDLFLGELSADQRKLPPRQVREQIQKIGEEYNIKEMTAIQKKYKEMFKSVPPEKIGEVIEAQGKEMDRLTEKVEAMRYPEASSRGGAITVNGQNVHYRGPKMHTQDVARAAEFQDLSAEPEIWITCGE